MRRGIAAGLAALLAAVSLAGCEQLGWNEKKETVSYPVTVGNVTVEKKPRGVGSLSPSLTKVLLDLGYQDRIVGYSDEDKIPEGVVLSDLAAKLEEIKNNPPETSAPAGSAESGETSAVSSKPASSGIEIPSGWDGKTPLPKEEVLYGTMGTALTPDMDKIGVIKPEIIFTTLPMTKAQLDRLSAANIKVMVMPAVSSVEELKQRFLDIITVMDGNEAAESNGRALVERFQSKIDYIVSKVPAQKQSFLYLCAMDPLVATGDTMESSLLSLLGDNAAREKTDYTLTAEEIKALDPDVILYSKPVERAHVEQSDSFKGKTAVKNGHLIEVDREALLAPVQGVVEALRNVAKQLYPDVDFTEPPPASSAAQGE